MTEEDNKSTNIVVLTSIIFPPSFLFLLLFVSFRTMDFANFCFQHCYTLSYIILHKLLAWGILLHQNCCEVTVMCIMSSYSFYWLYRKLVVLLLSVEVVWRWWVLLSSVFYRGCHINWFESVLTFPIVRLSPLYLFYSIVPYLL